MSEVTQEDRSMAAKWDEYLLLDTPDIVQAFARHREQAERETVEKIVAWLRKPLTLIRGISMAQNERLSDAIEAGEWK